MLNVHPSLIPRWRGAAPIERAMMAGDERTGTTILRVSEGLDSGPVALQERARDRAGRVLRRARARLAEQGGELLVRALDLRRAGELELTEQDEGAATYAEKITPEERRLDPGTDAAELGWKVRALNPHIGTYLAARGRRAPRRPPRQPGRGGAAGRARSPSARTRWCSGTAEAGLAPGGRAAARRPGDDGGRVLARAPGSRPGGLTRRYPRSHGRAHRRRPGRARRDRRGLRGRAAPPDCPGCGEPWLRPAQLPGRFVCVYCLQRFELVSQCPNCGEHQTISRMSRTEDMMCQHCGHSMLRSI